MTSHRCLPTLDRRKRIKVVLAIWHHETNVGAFNHELAARSHWTLRPNLVATTATEEVSSELNSSSTRWLTFGDVDTC